MNRRRFSSLLATGAAAGAAAGATGGLSELFTQTGRLVRDGALSRGVDPKLTRNRGAPTIDGVQLMRWMRDLRQFGGTPDGGTHRLAYTDADRDARAWVIARMREAGLEPSIDVAGNIIGRRAGTESSRPPITFGSHIDSVPYGGSFDGPLGVLGSIAVAHALSAAIVRTRHPLEVIVFQNEEGGVVGSRALVGELTDADLNGTSRSGKTLRDGMTFLGGDPARLAEARRAPGSITAYVELHIEQGGTLEATNTNIGVVEGIVGLRWWDVTITGFANHAGTTPMDQRQDAMRAAAQFVEMVNRVVRATPGRQVGTVGRIQAFPGAPNVIPGRVECSLEVRDLDRAVMDRLFTEIEREAHAIGRALGTTFAFAPTQNSAPALMHRDVMATIERVAKSQGASTRTLPSGAGHDAQHMAHLGPAGMIFVPSVKGISHSPAEFTADEDCVRGAEVLLETILSLDASPPSLASH